MSLSSSLLRVLMRLSVRGLQRRWRAALDNPAAAQEQSLLDTVTRHQDCEFGSKHGFSSIRSADDFRQAMPIHTCEDFAHDIERMKAGETGVLVDEPLEMFTVTSGTAGSPKFIPVTRSMNLQQHISHRLWMGRLVRDHPGLTDGRLFISVSPAVEGYTEGGIPYGSASGKNYINQPVPVRRMQAVPYEVISLEDYADRQYCQLLFALAGNLTCATSVNPSTLCLMAERLEEWGGRLWDDLAAWQQGSSNFLAGCKSLTPDMRSMLAAKMKVSPGRFSLLSELHKNGKGFRPAAIWPNLAVLCTWHGGNAPFYLKRLKSYWGEDVSTRCLGLRASEGMFSIPIADGVAYGPLAVLGHFMEFLPEETEPAPDAETLLAHELEVGRRYRLILTNSGGLWRYDIGDIVEVKGLSGLTPEVEFLHKAGKVLSITGEKVTEQQVVAVMERIGQQLPIAGFSVALDLTETPCYHIYAEPLPDAEWGEDKSKRLRALFDAELRRENLEYDSKRNSSRLEHPEVTQLERGTYAAWRRGMVEEGRPEGQIKPPHMLLTKAEVVRLLTAAEGD